MFGFGYKLIFKSRWAALAFAAFVCWSAAQIAAPDDRQAKSASQDDDATMAQMRAAERTLQNLDTAIP